MAPRRRNECVKRSETMRTLHSAYRGKRSFKRMPPIQHWPKSNSKSKAQSEKRYQREEGAWQQVSRSVKSIAPLSTCEYCRAASGSGGSSSEQHLAGEIEHFHAISNHKACGHTFGFDEFGFPVKEPNGWFVPDEQQNDRQGDLNYAAITHREDAEETPSAEKATQPFRLMDLAPELRKRIFEFAFASPTGVVCVADDVLRPTEGFNASSTVIPYSCTHTSACFPCQLHYQLYTMGGSGLSQASRQLHNETRLLPYFITTFSVHNLYYLFAFLQVIGPTARKALRSLRFDWRLPTTETRTLKITTDVEKTWQLLDDCSNVTSLEIDMHILNLLWWHPNGDRRRLRLDYLEQIPRIEGLLVPRGLRNVTFSWQVVKGVQSMEEWVKVVIGVWALPRGAEMQFDGVEADVEDVIGGTWKRVCWSSRASEVAEEVE